MLMLFLFFEEVVDLPTWFVFIGSARVSGKEMRLQGGICRWPITWAQALYVRPAGFIRNQNGQRFERCEQSEANTTLRCDPSLESSTYAKRKRPAA